MPIAATRSVGARVTRELLGELADRRLVYSYRMDSRRGLRVTLIEPGAAIARLEVPDRRGAMANVVLGCSSLHEWLANDAHFGATLGRYANRVAGSGFS